MTSKSRSKQQYWRAHVARVEKYAGSHEAYCRSAGISSPALKYWRNKIKKEGRMAAPPVPQFVPVEVMPERAAATGLPDPRWLAELIICLNRGRHEISAGL